MIRVSPDLEECPAAYDGRDILKLGVLTLWVDQETFLPLKTQQQEGEGNVLYTYEVTSIETGMDIDAATFVYEPPTGVEVVDVADLTGAKNVISGMPPEGEAPAECVPPPPNAEKPSTLAINC